MRINIGCIGEKAPPVFQLRCVVAGMNDCESGIREGDFERIARLPPRHLEFRIAAQPFPRPIATDQLNGIVVRPLQRPIEPIFHIGCRHNFILVHDTSSTQSRNDIQQKRRRSFLRRRILNVMISNDSKEIRLVKGTVLPLLSLASQQDGWLAIAIGT